MDEVTAESNEIEIEDLGESAEYEVINPVPVTQEILPQSTLPTLPEWATPPWPEWSDATINAEVWEQNESIEKFTDPTGMILPKNIKPAKWVRPDLLLEPPKLVDWGSGKIDLIKANIHVCELSDEIRFMLSEISELYDHGVKNAFQVEGEGTAFVPNSDHHIASWSPWDHIYSDCKAGVKGEGPKLNRIGKYYVRLYFMGAWRCITVDDQIPLLQDDRIALPISSNNELWPLILIKALIKLASLSWDYDVGEGAKKVHRFNTTVALTGWVHERVDVEEPVNNRKLWAELNDVLPKYRDRQETINYWTTGKTKKERLAEQMLLQKKETEKHTADVPQDVYTNWWTLTYLAEKIPGVKYLEYSDSEEALDEPTASAMSVVSEAEFEDEMEGEDMEIQIKESENTVTESVSGKKKKKGKKEKSKKGKRGVEKTKTVGDMSATESTTRTETDDEGGTKKLKKSKSSKSKKELKANKKGTKKGTSATDNSQLGDESNSILPENSKSKSSVKVKGSKSKSKGKKAKDKKGNKSEPEESNLEPKKKSKRAKRKKKLDGETATENEEEAEESVIQSQDAVDDNPNNKNKVPMMADILEGIHKFMGTENFPLVAAWESLAGKHIPDVITVVLALYPRVENAGPAIPSFLFHPINFVEVRDVPLGHDPDRPSTPLWKTFRWKDWAMRKGLIPMDTDPANIRCIKGKTPFALKTDWYHKMGFTHVEALGKGDEDEEEYLVGYAPPGTSAEDVCGGGNGTVPPNDAGLEEEEEEEGSVVTIAGPKKKKGKKGIKTKKSKSKSKKDSESKLSLKKSKSKSKKGSDSKLSLKKSKSKSKKGSDSKLSLKKSKSKSKKGSDSKVSLKKSKSKSKKDSDSKLSLNEKPSSASKSAKSSKAKSSSSIGSKRGKKNKKKGEKASKSKSKHKNIASAEQDEEEEEEWLWDSKGSAPMPTPVSEAGSYDGIPTSACGNVWFHVDNVSQYIRKLYKYYSSRTIFGSVFVLRRTPDGTDAAGSSALSQSTDVPAPPEVKVSQKEISNYHSVPDSFNLTIKFETEGMLSINDYHLTKGSGTESAFYLFSDCWMVQEILMSLDILQSTDVASYANKLDAAALNSPDDFENLEDGTSAPNRPLNVSLVLEPWDWRKDSSLHMRTPLVSCVTDAHWSAHAMLRPGRNLFRIWVSENLDNGEAISNTNPHTMSHYAIKVSAKTPMHVGTRDEIFKFMTNEPVLLLKQCDTLAQNLWAMFLLFGKPKEAYLPSLRSLHKSYCPPYQGKEPNCLYKKLKNVHFTFENKFLALIVKLNDGKLDRMLLLAMRCLFINPMLGQELWESTHPPRTPSTETILSVFDISEEKQLATLVIQRYCRGWLVRRLFHLRTPGSRMFAKIEFQVRKIAYLLALNTDSAFTKSRTDKGPTAPAKNNAEIDSTTVPSIEPSKNPLETNEKSLETPEESLEPTEKLLESSTVPPDQKLSSKTNQSVKHIDKINVEQFGSENEEETEEGLKFSDHHEFNSYAPPTLVPNPPKWAINLLKDVLKEHPLLFALQPHAYCLPHHIKIRDTEGTMPPETNNCAPFYRRVICVVGETNWCTCMVQLQVTPAAKVVLRVINNDTQTCLETESVQFFLGQLHYNKMGYTILCYSLNQRSKKSKATLEETPAFYQWKLRIVTAHVQDHLAYKDEIHEHHHHHHQHHHQPHDLYQFVPEESVDAIVENDPNAPNNDLEQPANNLAQEDQQGPHQLTEGGEIQDLPNQQVQNSFEDTIGQQSQEKQNPDGQSQPDQPIPGPSDQKIGKSKSRKGKGKGAKSQKGLSPQNQEAQEEQDQNQQGPQGKSKSNGRLKQKGKVNPQQD